MLKQENGPLILAVSPEAAIPGGELFIRGKGFGSTNGTRPKVHFGEAEASVLLWSEELLVARVPEGALPQLYR